MEANATSIIVQRFDALHCDLRIFACTDGQVGAEAPLADVKAEHTVNSLCGYGDTADLAIHSLWQAVLDMDTGRDWLRVTYSDECRRYYRWNGAAWKEREPEPAALSQPIGGR